MSDYLASLLGPLGIRRSVFVSYHHDNDQYYYNQLAMVCDAVLPLGFGTRLLREPLDEVKIVTHIGIVRSAKDI